MYPNGADGTGGVAKRPLPFTRYRTILADPPWDIHQKGSYGAVRHYPLMTLDAICKLRVDRLAAGDAHLWLWVTNAALPSGHHVLQAWGFTYRSCLTWIKPRLGLGTLPTQPNRALTARDTR